MPSKTGILASTRATPSSTSHVPSTRVTNARTWRRLLGTSREGWSNLAGYRVSMHSPRPTRESFHLTTAKICYITGSLTFEEFEAAVDHVLAGGTLTEKGRIPDGNGN